MVFSVMFSIVRSCMGGIFTLAGSIMAGSSRIYILYVGFCEREEKGEVRSEKFTGKGLFCRSRGTRCVQRETEAGEYGHAKLVLSITKSIGLLLEKSVIFTAPRTYRFGVKLRQ